MKSLGTYRKVAVVVVGLFVAFVLYRSLASRPPAPSPPASSAPPVGGPTALPSPAAPDAMAVVAPLAVGQQLAGWDVRAIYGVLDGSIWVIVKKGDALVHLQIARASDAGALPPAVVGPYAIFFSSQKPIPGGSGELVNALSEIVKANQSVPVPADLSPWKSQNMVPQPP